MTSRSPIGSDCDGAAACRTTSALQPVVPALSIALHVSNILLTDGSTYTLDNDFAFSERVGVINHYELRLTFDPAWQPVSAVPDAYTANSLAPGTGFTVTLPLRFVGPGAPRAQDGSRPPEITIASLVVAALTLVSAFWLFFSEEAKGRFAPVDTAGIDEAWLREHILKYPRNSCPPPGTITSGRRRSSPSSPVWRATRRSRARWQDTARHPA